MKIDCHLHLPFNEVLDSLEQKKAVFMDDLKRNSIDYAIIIPDHTTGSVIGDLDDVLALFRHEPQIFVMGTLNILEDSNDIYLKLDKHLKNKEIKAIKIYPGHDPHYPDDIRLTRVFQICVRYNAPLVIHTGWNSGNPYVAKFNDPKYIVNIAKKYTNLKIVISHYFWPEIEYCYEMTKNFDNIYFDTSALADEEVETETGKERIKFILEKTIAINPNKLLFGSDYSMCDISRHISLVESLRVDEETKERIFYKNAIELFNLNFD